MKKIAILLSIFVLVFGFVDTSDGSIIVFGFDGEITSIREFYPDRPMPSTWGIEVGGPFAGFLRIDTNAAVSPTCSQYGFLSPPSCYYGPASALVQFGEYATLGPRTLDLVFGDPTGHEIVPLNGIYLNGLRMGTNAPGMYVEDFGLFLNWAEPPLTSLDDLVTEFNLLTFTGGSSTLYASCCNGGLNSITQIDAEIDHVKAWVLAEPVPEPSTLLLLGSGLVGLGSGAWRRHRKR